jgi:hypothetical protein
VGEDEQRLVVSATEEEGEAVFSSPWSTVRARSGALVLGTVGGLVLAVAMGELFGDIVGLISLAVGFLLFGAGGLFCLPADKEVGNPTARGLLEGMVVVGWLATHVFT